MSGSVKIVSRTKSKLSSNNTYAEINEILDTFANVSKTKQADSVINAAFKNLISTKPEVTASWASTFYSTIYNSLNGAQETSGIAYVPTGKTSRLLEYERMARNAEVDACLDEIADESLNFNEKKQVIEIIFNDTDYIPTGLDGERKLEEQEKTRETLYKEFYKFIQPLKLKSKMHRYMKNFLKTGECCWENVIDKENTELGIIDFRFIPSHAFDFAYDTVTHDKLGIWVKVLKTKVGSSLNSEINPMNVGPTAIAPYTNPYSGTAYNIGSCNRVEEYANGDLLFLPFEQLTYVESGEHSPDELIVYPIIEKARRAYNQLLCIEDAIIIYRLARSPTRLVFNVGVGMANASKGTQQVQQLLRRYNVAKTYNSSTGTSSNSRDAHTMTESFWFMKGANGEGTDVTELSSSVNMGELQDLQYFQKKLWSALHVPAKRFASAEEVFSKEKENLTSDEYRFCKFIIRLLTNFSEAIKSSFLVHLDLIGLRDKLKIDDCEFDIHFVNPISYELYEQSRILRTRAEMFNLFADNDNFSKTLAMKKYLNFTDDEVEENWLELEKETIRKKIIEDKATAVSEDEIESFKQRLMAERAARKQQEDLSDEYEQTADSVESAVSSEKSPAVIQNGVQQMANKSQQLDNKDSQQGSETFGDFQGQQQPPQQPQQQPQQPPQQPPQQ